MFMLLYVGSYFLGQIQRRTNLVLDGLILYCRATDYTTPPPPLVPL